MKRVLAWILAACMLCFCLGGCGNDAGTKDLSWEKISTAGTLKVGIDPYHAPMSFYDSEGEATGFEVMLAKAVCARLGLQMKIVDVERKDAAERLKDGSIDCFWSGLVYNEKNEDAMELMEGYIREDYYVLVKKDTEARQLVDLEGMRLGVINTQGAYPYLIQAEYFVSLLQGEGFSSFRKVEEAVEELDDGKIDALILNSSAAKYYMNLGKEFRLLQNGLQTEVLLSEEVTVGVRSGELALLHRIREALETMQRDGSLERLSIAWFGEDIVLLEAEE